MSDPGRQTGWTPNLRLGVGLLVLGVLLSYWPVIDAGFIWDDDDYVTENVTLRSVDGLRRIWTEFGAVPQYYPLVHTSFWLEYHLWGLKPQCYHLVNVGLHALAAVLMWLLLRRLGLPGAWLAAALFVLHPVAVESVAWITERKNVLSLPLALAAMHFYLPWARLDDHDHRQPRRLGYLLALLCFTGAMLSKTVVCSVPAVLLVLIWWRRGRIGRRDVLPLLPFFAIGLALAGVTVWLEKAHVGARGVAWELTPGSRLAVAGRAVWFYLGKLLLPLQLSFIYPRWDVAGAGGTRWLYPAAAAVLAVALWQLRRAIGRGPLAALLVFVGVLTPALGFFDVYPMRYSYVADHFQYHAMPAVFALVAAAWTRWCPVPLDAARAEAWRPQCWSFVVVLFACAGLTWQRGHTYDSPEALWQDTLEQNPNAWIAHNNLGLIRFEQGNLASARKHFEAVLHLKPDHANAWNNLGRTLLRLRDVDAAELALQHALRLRPDDCVALNNLGNAYAARGDWGRALACYRRALDLVPAAADTWVNVGNALAEQRRWRGAMAAYRKALEITPELAAAQLNVARALATQGDSAAAEAAYRALVGAHPDHADGWYELGRFLAGLGRSDEALAAYLEAIRAAPKHADALAAAGALLMARGNDAEAARLLDRAAAVDPGRSDVHFRLGVLFHRHGQLEQAARRYMTVLKQRPDHLEALNNLGLVRRQQGHPDEARRLLEHVVAARPDAVAGWENLGDLEQQLGRHAEAVAAYRQVLARSPDQVDARLKLASLLAVGQLAPTQPAEAWRLIEQLPRDTMTAEQLDRVGLVLAANRRFSEAESVARRALAAAGQASDTALTARIRAHLAAYGAGHVYQLSGEGLQPEDDQRGQGRSHSP